MAVAQKGCSRTRSTAGSNPAVLDAVSRSPEDMRSRDMRSHHTSSRDELRDLGISHFRLWGAAVYSNLTINTSEVAEKFLNT